MKSAESNVIRSSVSGADKQWSNQELHDAMEQHWSAFVNRSQWKMWVFLAERAEDDNLGGIMFDAKIDEPEGIDRQGTAIFTRCLCFHSIHGEYIQDNPPAAEAVKRELFFNFIHETGHAFNLAHSFAKTRGTFWDAPVWIPPVTSDPKALSWMNYPDRASPGFNATWFYKRFQFRFDDNENLFLRHAPPQFVQMGSESWAQNHARVSRRSLDRRLELIIRSRKSSVELGEPILIETRLRNVSDENVMVHCHLNPGDGFVELAITKPNGERIPFVPITQTRVHIQPFILKPDQRLYHAINLTVGGLGFPFKEPGPYRIEASYTNLDGSTTAALMQLWVRPPANYDDWPVISEFFNARVGRVLYIDGSRVMADVRDKLKWISQHLGERHPAQYHLAKVQNIPLAKSFKLIKADTDKVDVLDSDPETVVRQLIPIIDNAETAADTIGHIDYRQVIDIYTQSALLIKKEVEARKAQEILLGLFKNRNVTHHVVEAIEQRLKELK